MKQWSFEIPGPLMGAVRTTQKQKWVDPRYKKYAAFKTKVRLLANVAGVPQELEKDESYGLALEVWWEKRARADLDNLEKGILDSCFKQDRRIIKIVSTTHEHAGIEKANVTVIHYDEESLKRE